MEDLITIEKIVKLGFKEKSKKHNSYDTWYKKGILGISKLDENIYGYCFLISFTFDLGEDEKITHINKKHIKYMSEIINLDSILNY